MRFQILALPVFAVLTSPLLGYAQDVAPGAATAATPAPGGATEAVAPSPVAPAATPATEAVAPSDVTAPVTETATSASTAPTDRVVITPQTQESDEGQIDLQALAEEEELPRFVLEGYYRVRGNYLREMDLDRNTKPSVERYFQHRLRLEPKFNLNSKVVFKAEVDAMDDQVWGANPGNVLSQSTSDRSPNLIVKRAWADITLPFGQLSAGRMPSNWGMGLFSNDGNGFRNEFGDSHDGTTFDRVAFGTKPLGVDSNWIVAAVYDKIVADQPAELVSPLNKDPVDELVGVVLFQTDPLKAGAYELYRFQDATDTKINATDIYFKLDLGLLYVETEHVIIHNSETKAVPILNQANFTVSNPKVEISQYGYAAKVGLNVDPYGVEMEWGNATGDRNGFNDFDKDTKKAAPKVTNYKFHPDYNVGLIMFEYANAMYAQNALNTQIAGLATLQEQGIVAPDVVQRTLSVADLALTNGSVTNALYLNPKLRLHAADGLIDVTLAYLYASANAPKVILQQGGRREYSDYGNEFDASVNFNFTKNFVFGLQYGYFRPGNYFNRQDFITGYIQRPDKAQLGQGRFTVLF